jgi:ABC-type uncharacterized transport system permease subunit
MPLPATSSARSSICIAGAVAARLGSGAGWLRQYRGINETISSLLLAYVAIGLFKHLVEGPLRDPASLNKPSTLTRCPTGLRIGGIAGSDVHWGLVIGVVACIGLGLWLRWTASGFSVRVVGGNPRAAQLVGLPATQLILLACGVGGACAGLAGAVEVAAVHTNANASLIAGYGYAGILVSFMARHNPMAIIPVAILFGGFGAAGSLLQRRLGLPDASVLVLQGIAFVLILASEGLRDVDWKFFAAEVRIVPPRGPAQAHQGGGMTADQWIALVAGIVGGALRVGAPFLFVSLGECLTEKSGRINLGLEGVLVLSAMAAFGGAYLTDSAWLGVLIGAAAGAVLALLHGLLCSLARVNDVATGIALMLLGTGLAFYLGKPLIQPQAPQLPAIPLGFWSDNSWCSRRCRSMRWCLSASCWRG